MKSVIAITAASAALSAILVASLAAADAMPVRRAAAPAPTAWVEPPAKAAPACGEAAWPYRPGVCTAAAPVRKVRVILLDGRDRAGTAPVAAVIR